MSLWRLRWRVARALMRAGGKLCDLAEVVMPGDLRAKL